MIGKVEILNLYDPSKKEHGFIRGNDNELYYFNEDSLIKNASLSNFYVDDEVSFTPESTPAKYDKAKFVKLENAAKIDDGAILGRPGIAKRLDINRAATESLKDNSGELEIIHKLSEILLITRIGHHIMDQYNSKYEFCLAGVTDTFKQFIRESGEFLIIFSHFDDESWQEKTLKVHKELRKRREIVERRPLANFYILISNASELRNKINSIKGNPTPVVIPFSFNELLACKNKAQLADCMLGRFKEYYFENNMLAESQAIDDDSLLFGDRGKIADSIVARCHQNSNSGIFGLRRSGKTSVLNAVLRRLEYENTAYILIESRTYETVHSWKQVLFDIARLVRARRLNVEREPTESLPAFYKRLKISSKYEDYEKRAVAAFIEDVRRYCGKDNLIIAIDEVELITYNSATSNAWKNLEAYKGFWSALRDCGCPLVVCGVNSTINEVSAISFNGDECDNPMYGRIINCAESEKTYLPAFSAEQTKEMINKLGQYSNIAFSNVYDIINEAFGGQPWAIRQFCSYVFDSVKSHRNFSRIYEVSKATCKQLLREFQTSSIGVSLCETILQHLRIYPSEYNLLVKIALNPESYTSISSDDVISIDHLQKYGLIEYDISTNYISFCIGIISEYIKKEYTKDPRDMNSNERRRYIQDTIALCEKKLKTYIKNYCIYNASSILWKDLFFDEKGKCVLKAHRGVDIQQCSLADFLDHKKFDFYFSKLKSLIEEHWDTLGKNIEAVGISREKFICSMDDLNAGRTDADHYDPENSILPADTLEIDDETIQSFCVAYNTLQKFFTELGL